jgi:putative ABC transport system ATP-binding protein
MMRDAHPTEILRTENLGRVVKGKTLVAGVSLQVSQGDVIAIVGPSGAGKSSLLRLFNRLDEPTSGTVWLEGVDYRRLPPPQLRQRVGMVLQTPYLFPGTVADNLRFGPQQRGQYLAATTIEDLLDRVNLPGYGGRDVANLSGGEAQRVSLARTLANRPKVLLLDEPTSALDESTRRDVEELICSIINRDHLTCLMVTHDLAQARRMSHRLLYLEAGRVTREGAAEEVLDA